MQTFVRIRPVAYHVESPFLGVNSINTNLTFGICATQKHNRNTCILQSVFQSVLLKLSVKKTIYFAQKRLFKTSKAKYGPLNTILSCQPAHHRAGTLDGKLLVNQDQYVCQSNAEVSYLLSTTFCRTWPRYMFSLE